MLPPVHQDSGRSRSWVHVTGGHNMPHALVENYINERDQLVNTITVLKNTTLDRGADPSDQDLELMTKGVQPHRQARQAHQGARRGQDDGRRDPRQAAARRRPHPRRRHEVPQRRRDDLGLPARQLRQPARPRGPGSQAPLGLGDEACRRAHGDQRRRDHDRSPVASVACTSLLSWARSSTCTRPASRSSRPSASRRRPTP